MATILVGPEETKFVVHQALLCDKSPYFAKALTGAFEESKTGIVKLEDISPFLFNILVSWLYYGKIVYTVSDNGSSVESEFADFRRGDELLAGGVNADDTSTWPKLLLVELYVRADRLDIKELRTNAIDVLNDSLMHSKRTPHLSCLLYACERGGSAKTVMIPARQEGFHPASTMGLEDIYTKHFNTAHDEHNRQCILQIVHPAPVDHFDTDQVKAHVQLKHRLVHRKAVAITHRSPRYSKPCRKDL
jgi:hypothetical protein